MNSLLDRRRWFDYSLRGVGATALLQLLLRDGFAQADEPADRDDRQEALPSHTPRVKRAIQICLIGGLSHLDSLDYKPELARFHGKSLQSDEQPDIFFGQVGLIRQSDWQFRQYGQSGLWLSSLFPQIAERADDLTIIRSMVSDSANHTPALFFANSGFQFNGYPSLGSWLSYGLGSDTESLPDYVALPDTRGGPTGGASNWSNGFLPARHQGVEFRGLEQPVRDLFPARSIFPEMEADTREFLRLLNEKHLQQAGDDENLVARLRSYELAAQMQLSVPEVSDLSDETRATRELYGLDEEITRDMGQRCLLGRLLEKGVRFVQVFSGGPIGGSPRVSWDAHENVQENHTTEARRIDRPVAGLLQDLKQRGLLDDTLVMFTTEFGRTPFTQSAADSVGTGRDHNRYGFSVWLAGAGLKPGLAYGETDEIGWKVASNPVTWHDFHATILHLFGIDHTRLTYYHNGIQRRLTNVHGELVSGILDG
jgi:Protein of unknown function (DUF1501)